MKSLAIKLGVFAASSLFALNAFAKEIEVFFTNNPPLICSKNNELDCVAGNLIKNAAKAGGFKLKLNEVPWAQAKNSIAQSPNALFAATGRNEFSEPNFNWYFQIYSDDVFVFTLGDKKIANDQDLQKLDKIAVRRGSPFQAYIEKRGAKEKVTETNEWVQAAQMLQLGRVDAMCLTGLIGKTNIVDLQKIPESTVNKYKVGDISWWLITAQGKPVSAEMTEFKALLAAEREKADFQNTIKKLGVRL